MLRCFYELFSRSEQQFHMSSARGGAWVDAARGIRALASRRGPAGAAHKAGSGVVRGDAPLRGRGGGVRSSLGPSVGAEHDEGLETTTGGC